MTRSAAEIVLFRVFNSFRAHRVVRHSKLSVIELRRMESTREKTNLSVNPSEIPKESQKHEETSLNAETCFDLQQRISEWSHEPESEYLTRHCQLS